MGSASSFCYIDFSSGYKECPKTYYKESFNYSIFLLFYGPLLTSKYVCKKLFSRLFHRFLIGFQNVFKIEK